MCFQYLQLLSGVTDWSSLVQQQGLGGQAFIGESRSLEPRSPRVGDLEDQDILFPSVLHLLRVITAQKNILHVSISATTTSECLSMPRPHHLRDNPTSIEIHWKSSMPMANRYQYRINCCHLTPRAPQIPEESTLALKLATRP